MKCYSHFDWDSFFKLLLVTPTGFGISFQYTPQSIRELTLTDCWFLVDAINSFNKEQEKEEDQLPVNPASLKQTMQEFQREYREKYGL